MNQHFVLMVSKTAKKLGLIDATDMTISFCTRIIKNNVLTQWWESDTESWGQTEM